ncbi:MAG TPA: pre-peptidase C-terminal domain-containing protein, partial [Planctomycetaceae bacterium]|nr:pre-peptidase C-terminal domain-containing protein [Planctomycetaceae bacterium]
MILRHGVHFVRLSAGCLAILFSTSGLLSAQTPTVSVVSPQGLTPGQTVPVKISGGNLAGATQLWTSFPTTSQLSTATPDNGKQPNEVTFDVTVPADAAPGVHGLRLVTDKGVSPLKLIVVEPFPVVVHNNQNKTQDTAQEVPVPCTIEGHIDNLSRVYYRFKAGADQQISFEVQARRLGSPLDPMLRLFDASGRELAWSDDEAGLQGDSRFAYRFATAGDYAIELSDVRYQGSGNHRFRLRIGEFPLVTTPYPMVVQVDRPTSLAFAGEEVEPTTAIQNLTIPNIPGLSPGGELWMPIAAGTSGFSLLGVSSTPQFDETEPNNTAEQANRVELGTSLNGRFQEPRDVDRFVFAAKAGQKYRFTAITRQAGSPADLQLQFFKPDGGKLAEIDDVGLEDSSFDFNSPADGDYTLVVKDLHEHGGPQFTWHVKVEPIKTSFLLTSSAETLNVPVGGILPVSVQSQRKGYNGSIKIEARNLPAGFESLPTWIGPGRNDAVLTIRTGKDAAAGSLAEIQIVGSAEIDGA